MAMVEMGKISSRGQVAIPSDIRSQLGLEDEPGAVVHWLDTSTPPITWQVEQPAGAVVWRGELQGEPATVKVWRGQFGAWDIGPLEWRRGDNEGLAGLCEGEQ